jgi:hypothetical protein
VKLHFTSLPSEVRYSLTYIKAQNRAFYGTETYPGMNDVVSPGNVRYHFSKSDAKTLYRAYHRCLGIDVSKEPRHNVHQWLDPEATEFCAPLAEAADYYRPRLTSGRLDRFELVLSSPAMKGATLRFCTVVR